jgi:hypothetical protein
MRASLCLWLIWRTTLLNVSNVANFVVWEKNECTAGEHLFNLWAEVETLVTPDTGRSLEYSEYCVAREGGSLNDAFQYWMLTSAVSHDGLRTIVLPYPADPRSPSEDNTLSRLLQETSLKQRLQCEVKSFWAEFFSVLITFSSYSILYPSEWAAVAQAV